MSETLTPPAMPATAPPPEPGRRRNWLPTAVTVLLLAGLVLLPALVGDASLAVAQYILIGVVGGIGLTLLIGQAGQLSLAHPFFLLVGAVSYAVLAGDRGAGGLVGLGLPPLLALVLAVLISGLFGLLCAPVAGRLRGIRLGVASLTLVMLGRWLGKSLLSLTGGPETGRPAPVFELFGLPFADTVTAPTLLGVTIGKEQRLWYLFLVLAVITYVLARGAVHSRTGRAWRAVRDHEAVAVAMGVRPWRVRAGAFTVSAAFAGLAGVMTALWLEKITPGASEFGGSYSLLAAVGFLAVVLVGGSGSVSGAVVGAVVVFGAQQLARFGADRFGLLTGGLGPDVLGAFVSGAAVVIVLLLEPGGLAAVGRRLVLRRRPDPAVDGPAPNPG